MYEHLQFAPRKEATRVTEMNDALRFLQEQQLTVKPVVTSVGELEINPDGTIKNGELRTTTQYGFESFCKILGIPNPFARMIPEDLLFINIHRLQKENASDPIVLLERPDGIIANIVKAPYRESSYGEILAFFDGMDIRYIDIGERWMTFCTMFAEAPIHYGDQDTMYVGTFVHGSITKETGLYMDSGLYRTSCENSFLMPYFGRVRANYRAEEAGRLAAFSSAVRCYDSQILEQLRRGFMIFETRKMFRKEVVQVWRRLNNLVGETNADQILTIDHDTRVAAIELEHAESIDNKISRLQGKAVADPVLTDLSYYEVLNNITFHAKGMHEKAKLEVERLAGSLLGQVILN